jgi:translation elongation factor EF-1alpha
VTLLRLENPKPVSTPQFGQISQSQGFFSKLLEQAGRLSRTFAMLLDALNRHRGKGSQKITVEHEHVHTGGQAVVGIVEAPGGVSRNRRNNPTQLPM